jgi:hypothetical protein
MDPLAQQNLDNPQTEQAHASMLHATHVLTHHHILPALQQEQQ